MGHGARTAVVLSVAALGFSDWNGNAFAAAVITTMTATGDQMRSLGR